METAEIVDAFAPIIALAIVIIIIVVAIKLAVWLAKPIFYTVVAAIILYLLFR
jgi:hypothetical protein